MLQKAGYPQIGNNWLQNDAKNQQIILLKGFKLALRVGPLRRLENCQTILAVDVESTRIFDPIEGPNNPLDKYSDF